jgi:Tol biopolymer transport system component
MLFHIRYGPAAGTLLVHGDTLVRVDTRTSFNKLPGAYRSWHPNGKLLAFSTNAVRQFFHATGEVREAADLTSDLILYQIGSNTVTTCPMISSPDRMETYPEWSPDGQYLYFCSAPQIAADVDISQQYQNIHYDLMRIRYHAEDGSWGELETVLSAKQTGLSIAHPKISPDGRFLLFCMADHGTFTLFRPGGDLYLMDLKTGQYNNLTNVNSPQPESYHSWSSNSRWFTFSSKRYNEICALVYFCYVDDDGKVYKPFLLPQKDPDLYDDSFKTFNVPELLRAPIKYTTQQLTKAALNNRKAIQAEFDKDAKIDKTTKDAPPSFH